MMNVPCHHNSSQESPSEEWLQRTQLFVRWQVMKQEIMLHKWYESERAGHDVGWERAATNWMIHYGQRFKGDADHHS